MFFRALTMFRFPKTLHLDDLSQALEACALRAVGPLELSSRGFVAPIAEGMSYIQRSGDSIWLTLGGEDRLLPEAVVTKALAERLDQIRAKTGRMPGGRARRQLREDIVVELLPRAFVKTLRMDALVDTTLGMIAVDSGSRRAAEAMVSEIRAALGSFPALPLNAEISPRLVLTRWAAGETLPEGLSLGGDCTLEDAADSGSKVRCYRVDMQSDEIAEHLQAGRQATRLSLVLDDRLAFDLDESLVVRKLQLLDGALDALEQMEREDVAGELQARFALLAGEVHRLFLVLQDTLHLSTMEG